MTLMRTLVSAALVAAFAISASAQPQGAASAPGLGASGPGMGMGMGPGGMGMGPGGKGMGPGGKAMGPGAGMGPGTGMGGMQGHRMRADAGNTPGWSMMSPTERQEHQQHLMTMKSADECKAYMTKHHDEMMERAKKRGVAAPAQPRRDMCAGLK